MSKVSICDLEGTPQGAADAVIRENEQQQRHKICHGEDGEGVDAAGLRAPAFAALNKHVAAVDALPRARHEELRTRQDGRRQPDPKNDHLRAAFSHPPFNWVDYSHVPEIQQREFDNKWQAIRFCWKCSLVRWNSGKSTT